MDKNDPDPNDHDQNDRDRNVPDPNDCDRNVPDPNDRDQNDLDPVKTRVRLVRTAEESGNFGGSGSDPRPLKMSVIAHF